MSLERKERFDIGRQLERDSLSRFGFLTKGVTMVSLKERLIMFVITGARMSTHFLTCEVGIGSS